jgi:hypothetical protein
MKYFFYILAFLFISCSQNYNRLGEKVTYYKDFDFVNLKGIDIIDKNDFDDVIEVFKTDEKLILKQTSTDYIDHSYDIVFLKKDGFYSSYDEPKVEDPAQTVKETFYLKDGIGMKFHLSYDDGKPSYCHISEINFKKNEIKEIQFYEKHIQPSPDLTFEKLKNHKDISFITTTNIYEDKGRLKKVWKDYNLQTKEETTTISYYEGYPDSKINQFWNLYRYYFGGEIR